MKKFIRWAGCISVLVIMVINFPGCRKQDIKQTTTTDVNIVDYLKRSPDQFSEFIKILDRTNISPYLNAYGTYTVFAPTNNAIQLYLQQLGKTSTDDLDTATLRGFVQFHLIQDTISTSNFTDGKISTPTMYGQYLITSVNDGGVTVVNRQANIIQSNIETGNGIIHVIDHVLQPAKLTLAQLIEKNTKYSIFTQALKATGLYDTLNLNNNPDTTRRWLTVLAESDSVLRAAGINSYSDLVKKYNNTGNARNQNDSLYLYTSYHILTGLKYVADIISSQSHQTLAPLNVVTQTLVDQQVLLNQVTFNGVNEPGVLVDRVNSDNSATNGVLNVLLGDIYLKVRFPVPVYFDLGDQPEIRKMTSIFRKPGKSVVLTLGQLADVTWTPGNTIQYTSEGATSTNYYYWDDHMDFDMRTATNSFIEFTTPLLVTGKYKVWIDYRRGAPGATQILFDGAPLQRVVDFSQYLTSTTATDPVLESQGNKRYAWQAPLSNTTQVSQLAGTINVTTTDRHKIRFQALSNNKGAGTFDMIEFRPIDMDQQWPRFGRDGSIKLTP